MAAKPRGRLVWSGGTRVRCGALVETGAAEAADGALLAERVRRDGYLLVRGLLARRDVLAARAAIFGAVGVGDVGSVSDMPSLMGRQDVAALPAVRRVLESAAIAVLLRRIASASSDGGGADPLVPIPFKWLRAVPPGLFTGVHFDRVYFPAMNDNTQTAWTPLGDVPVEHGAMMVCEGAHRHGHPRYDVLRSYLTGEGAVSGTRAAGNGTDSGWYARDAAQVVRDCPGARWLTADLRAGDVVILPLETLHCTAVNTLQRHRISCDVRWVPLPIRQGSDEEKGSDGQRTEGEGKRRRRR